MRLIDADALTDELLKGIEADTGKSVQTAFTKSVCMILCKAIEQQPTIHAAPERTGTWSEEYDPNDDPFFRKKYRCSACGDWNTYGFTRFCPACGARMLNASALAKENEQ